MHVLHFLWQELSQQDTRRYKREPGAVSISKNPFVICAQAAELTKDKPVYIKEAVSNTFGYAAWMMAKPEDGICYGNAALCQR